MDKETKKNLTIAGLGIATGVFVKASFTLAFRVIDLEKENSWLKQRVDTTVKFINDAQNVGSGAEEAALVEKFDTDIKFLDQIHGY